MRVIRLSALVAASALTGCTMMMDDGSYYSPAPPPVYSETIAADDYGWIDRADSLWEVIGDAPPDFAFAFEGAEPWAWETRDGFTVIVEDGRDGIRSYYFDPGAPGPFLVVEPGMSFGFDGEAIAMAYGPDGTALSRDDAGVDLNHAVALFARASAMKRALLRREWREVDSQAWVDTSPMIFGFVEIWGSSRQLNPGWRSYHDRAQAEDWRRRMDAERVRRQAEGDQFRRWREGGYSGNAPGRWRRPGERKPGEGWQGARPGGAMPTTPGATPARPAPPPRRGTPPVRKPIEGIDNTPPVDDGPNPPPPGATPPQVRPGWSRRGERPQVRPGWSRRGERPVVPSPGANEGQPGTPGNAGRRRWNAPPLGVLPDGNAGQPGAAPATPGISPQPRPRRPRWDAPPSVTQPGSNPEQPRSGWPRRGGGAQPGTTPAAPGTAPQPRPTWQRRGERPTDGVRPAPVGRPQINQPGTTPRQPPTAAPRASEPSTRPSSPPPAPRTPPPRKQVEGVE